MQEEKGEAVVVSVTFREGLSEQRALPLFQQVRETAWWALSLHYLQHQAVFRLNTTDYRLFRFFTALATTYYNRSIARGHRYHEAVDGYVVLTLWRLQRGCCAICAEAMNPFTEALALDHIDEDDQCYVHALGAHSASATSSEHLNVHRYQINVQIAHRGCQNYQRWQGVGSYFHWVADEFEQTEVEPVARFVEMGVLPPTTTTTPPEQEMATLAGLYDQIRPFVEEKMWQAEYRCLTHHPWFAATFENRKTWKKLCGGCATWLPLHEFQWLVHIKAGQVQVPDDVATTCFSCRYRKQFGTGPGTNTSDTPQDLEQLSTSLQRLALPDQELLNEDAEQDEEEEEEKEESFPSSEVESKVDAVSADVVGQWMKQERKCAICAQEMLLYPTKDSLRSIYEQIEMKHVRSFTGGGLMYDETHRQWIHRICHPNQAAVRDAKNRLVHLYDRFDQLMQQVEEKKQSDPQAHAVWLQVQQRSVCKKLRNIWPQVLPWLAPDNADQLHLWREQLCRLTNEPYSMPPFVWDMSKFLSTFKSRALPETSTKKSKGNDGSARSAGSSNTRQRPPVPVWTKRKKT